MLTEPFVASVSKLKVRLSPSISLPDKLTTTLWSSFVVVDKPAVATGASLTAFTVTVILCESDSSPSLTVKVNVSLPLKLSEALKETSVPLNVAVISVPPLTL